LCYRQAKETGNDQINVQGKTKCLIHMAQERLYSKESE
jgi:hypothetical protein